MIDYTDPVQSLAHSRACMVTKAITEVDRLRRITVQVEDFLNATVCEDQDTQELLDTILWVASGGMKGRDYTIAPRDVPIPESVTIQDPTPSELAVLQALGVRNDARR